MLVTSWVAENISEIADIFASAKFNLEGLNLQSICRALGVCTVMEQNGGLKETQDTAVPGLEIQG